MATTIGTTYKGSSSAFRAALAIASVVAVAAVAIGVAVFGGGNGDRAAPASEAVTWTSTAPVTRVVYYLVSTQEEADTFQFQEQEAKMLAASIGYVESGVEHVFLPIDTPEREAMLQLMLQDLNAYALESGTPGAEVIDLRNP